MPTYTSPDHHNILSESRKLGKACWMYTWMGFIPMTFAIQIQCSASWPIISQLGAGHFVFTMNKNNYQLSGCSYTVLLWQLGQECKSCSSLNFSGLLSLYCVDHINLVIHFTVEIDMIIYNKLMHLHFHALCVNYLF